MDQRTNELLKLKKEAEIAQTDRIRERLNEQVLNLENRNGNLTQELKEVLDQRTNELLKLKMEAEGTTQDLQQRIEEISKEKNPRSTLEDRIRKLKCWELKKSSNANGFSSLSENAKMNTLLKRLSTRMSQKLLKLHPPMLCTALAIRDCVPSPYDKQGLPFKTGDKIKVTKMNENGTWRGSCNGREGNFKFVDVKRESSEVKRNYNSKNVTKCCKIPRSRSVSDLLSTINLENLTPVFVLNGYDSIDDVEDICDDDLNYLGITDENMKDLIIDTINTFTISDTENAPTNKEVIKKFTCRDSGISCSEESLASDQGTDNSPPKSFLHQLGYFQRQNSQSDKWRDSVVFGTEITWL